MRSNRLSERGITILELVIAIGIFAILVVPLSAIVYKSSIARRTGQDSLYGQQDGAVVLSRFTNDVRASTYMVSSLGQTSAVTMRQPTSLTTSTYVTWRIDGGKLQRGQSPSAATLPTSWQDVIDPRIFSVEAGQFAYYTLNNGVPKSNDEARRLELRSLTLKSKTTGSTLVPPAVSAVMREPAQARALTVTGPWTTWGDDQNWHNAVHVSFPLKNQSDKGLSVGSFAATWDDHSAGGYIKSMDLAGDSSSSWGGGQATYFSGDAPQDLDRPLTLGAGSTGSITFHFMAGQRIESFTMTLYEASDTTHSKPYVLKVQ
ncbi:MAG TPA: hypothetical protein V6D05_03690 [Stenomitos sp.]